MRVMESVKAHDITSMHCGGTVERIYEPESISELSDLISELKEFHILGHGTNTIFEDTSIAKPVIRLGREFAVIKPITGGLHSGSAVPMRRLLSFCVQNGLAGIEFMAGIPGQLGGALFMNAGTAGKGILDAAIELEVADGSGVHTVKKEGLRYSYREGGIPRNTVITSAKLHLEQSTREAVRQAVLTYMKKRRAQPHAYCSGSIFRNPEGAAAGYLIDTAGLKGLRVGGAQVSWDHANFIVNVDNATTGDIKELIRQVKERVRGRFGIELCEEVMIIGQ